MKHFFTGTFSNKRVYEENFHREIIFNKIIYERKFKAWANDEHSHDVFKVLLKGILSQKYFRREISKNSIYNRKCWF